MTVSNEELLNDIRNTEREIDAYQKLADGFYILAQLPENWENARKHNFEGQKYSRLASECQDFLGKLYDLKAERGL